MTLAKTAEDEELARLNKKRIDQITDRELALLKKQRIQITCDRCYMPFSILEITMDGKPNQLGIDVLRAQYQNHLASPGCRSTYKQDTLVNRETGLE